MTNVSLLKVRILKSILTLCFTTLFLLAASLSYGTGENEIFHTTIVSDGSSLISQSHTFTGQSRYGTIKLTITSPDQPSLAGDLTVYLFVNGKSIFYIRRVPDDQFFEREILLYEGENNLGFIMRGQSGIQIDIDITGGDKVDAVSLIGAAGGTVDVTDTESEAHGVRIEIPSFAIIEETIFKIAFLSRAKNTPLFPPYQEVLSPLIKFSSSNPISGDVKICFPLSDPSRENYHLNELAEEQREWTINRSTPEISADGNEICAQVDHLSQYAITADSDCSAPGARLFDGTVHPTCREKWESSLYYALVAPQLLGVAESIYQRDLLGELSPEDVIRSRAPVAEQLAELNGLHSKKIDQVWLNSETEVINLAEQFFGAEFATTWFASMFDVLTATEVGENPAGITTEEDLTTLANYFDSLAESEKRQRMNEFLIGNEFLYEYYRFGADESLVKERFDLSPDLDLTAVINETAAKMGFLLNPEKTDYDPGRVSSILNDSLALIYRFAGEFTKPQASTMAASELTITGATLTGSVNPSGLSTDTWFEWGSEPDLNTYIKTPTQPAGSESVDVPVSQSLSDLNPLSTYYFRIAASNSTGNVQGSVMSLTTIGIPPTVTHSSGEPKTGESAILTGDVNPNGLQSEAWIEWGQDPTLTSFASTAVQPIGSGTTSQPINRTLEGLSPRVPYYFRVAASNRAGSTKGPIMSFLIPDIIVTTRPASNITTVSATLTGLLDHGGSPSMAWFEWSELQDFSETNNSPPQYFGEGESGITVLYQLQGLSPNRTYYYRLIATSDFQTKMGSIASLTTPPVESTASTTTLFWKPPETRIDGSLLDDLAGFKIYFGTSKLTYTNSIDVKLVTRYTLLNLPKGTWYFAVTAYDSSGNESPFSNELSKTIE